MNAIRQKAIEGLEEGDTFEIKRTFSEADIVQFEALSHDHNPVHSDARYAVAKGFDGSIAQGMALVERHPFSDDIGIDAVADGDTRHGCPRLQAFLNDLGFERFRIRASLTHGNPGDKGDRVRLKIRGHHRP